MNLDMEKGMKDSVFASKFFESKFNVYSIEGSLSEI